jgi:hypothetical protein
MPPVGTILFGSVFGVLALGNCGGGWVEQHMLHKKLADKSATWTKGELRDAFTEAQKQAYAAQKRQIVQAAEQYLSSGKLVSVEEASWLAALDPEAVRGATDQLAITVLQIRKMLAHMRCADFNADGSRAVEKPLTFEAMLLMSSAPLHRSILRERLAAEDCEVTEDLNPVIREPEVISAAHAKVSVIKSLASFISFRTKKSLAREYVDNALPRFADIEAQALRPVTDFAAMLESYEARNPPLDLPALRGWKTVKRRALPHPGGMA